MLLLELVVEQPILSLLLGHMLLKLVKLRFQREVLVVEVLWAELRRSRFPPIDLIFEVLKEETGLELHFSHAFMRLDSILEKGMWLGWLVDWRHINVIGLLDK
jgi:hypothetical protein